MQLLAIKALQSRGQSLQTVQAQLAGQPDAVLAALIGLPRTGRHGCRRERAAPRTDRSPGRKAGSRNPRRRLRPALGTSAGRGRYPPEPSASAPSKSPTDAPTGLVADGLWASTNVPSASTDVPTGSVAELLAVTLAPGARLLLDRRRYPELDGRLEAALRNLAPRCDGCPLPKIDPMEAKNGDEFRFPDRVGRSAKRWCTNRRCGRRNRFWLFGDRPGRPAAAAVGGVNGRITGLLYRLAVAQEFVNVCAEPLEATYIFPLPARAGVTRFRLRGASGSSKVC